MTGNEPSGDKIVALDKEMAAFDRLGPQTRSAINGAGLKVSALSVLAALTNARMDPEAEIADQTAAEAVRQASPK